MKQQTRLQIIFRAGVWGMAMNILLASVKIFIGFRGNSLAIVVDALNNISDVFSSLITVVAAKLAGKSPDKEHPQGHGRYEYISGFLVAAFIFYAGITALTESVKRIMNPEIVRYSHYSFLFLVFAISVKFFFAHYADKKGKEIHSESLRTLAKDSLFDAFVSTGTLMAAFANLLANMYFLEGYFGLVLSLFYILSGIASLRSNVSSILGERVHNEISSSVLAIISQYEKVKGAYDLIFTDYGPDQFQASVRIEVSEKLSALEIDNLSRMLEREIYQKTNVIMTAIGIYADCEKEKELQEEVSSFLLSYPSVIQVHGFRATHQEMFCEIVIPFEEKRREQLFREIKKALRQKYKNYEVHMILDGDSSDIL